MLDYYSILDLMESEDRQIQFAAREYLDSEISSYASEWWEQGDFPQDVIPAMGEMGFLGSNLP